MSEWRLRDVENHLNQVGRYQAELEKRIEDTKEDIRNEIKRFVRLHENQSSFKHEGHRYNQPFPPMHEFIEPLRERLYELYDDKKTVHEEMKELIKSDPTFLDWYIWESEQCVY